GRSARRCGPGPSSAAEPTRGPARSKRVDALPEGESPSHTFTGTPGSGRSSDGSSSREFQRTVAHTEKTMRSRSPALLAVLGLALAIPLRAQDSQAKPDDEPPRFHDTVDVEEERPAVP